MHLRLQGLAGARRWSMVASQGRPTGRAAGSIRSQTSVPGCGGLRATRSIYYDVKSVIKQRSRQ
jgi:hypothetical protein